MESRRTIFIAGISSDIGQELAIRYRAEGHDVWGSYRHRKSLNRIDVTSQMFPCDYACRESVDGMFHELRDRGFTWDILISAVGTEEPIGPFFSVDFDAWQENVQVNALSQLRLLHGLYGMKRQGDPCKVIFFAGAGTNDAAIRYSGYSLSKILLIKMAEILDAECPDLHLYVIGPGIVRTKIHQQTLNNPRDSGPNFEKVTRFLSSDDPGVSHDEIHACIDWCIETGGETMSGRNLSLVHDPWKGGGTRLLEAIRNDQDMFKLRRSGNDALK